MSLFSYLFHSTPSEDDADLILYAPVNGHLVPLSEVPDVVISEHVVGEGVAFIPESDTILAPCDGTVSRLLATHHAFSIRDPHNLEIYVSFGIGAMDLGGEGMQALVNVGDPVKKGDPILHIDLARVASKVKSTATSLIVVRSSGPIDKVTAATGNAKAGTTPCLWVRLQHEEESAPATQNEESDL